MGWFSRSTEDKSKWKILDDVAQLDEIVETSKTKPVAIFKHSTRCSISSAAKSRMDNGWDVPEEEVEVYYLDLIANRGISNTIAERFGVRHESPQVILFKGGQAVYHASHFDIRADVLKEQV